MATQHSRSAARLMMAPAVILLLGWMLVPLIMTLMFSFKKYLPLRGGDLGWIGFDNYIRFVTSSAFWPSVVATLAIVGGVLAITVVFGVLLALLLNQPMWGQGVVRILVIAPFFVMPTVSALVWKNMFMDPVNGLLAHLWRFFGADPVVWLSNVPTGSLILIVSWQWLPFATLILLTAVQSLDGEQLEAAEMDGANAIQRFFTITLPMMRAQLGAVISLGVIFTLQQFDLFAALTQGGPSNASNVFQYWSWQLSFQYYEIGVGSVISVLMILFVIFVAAVYVRSTRHEQLA